MRHKRDPLERFWEKVNKEPGLGPWGDCWEWIAGKDGCGYAKFNFSSGKYAKGHRWIYEATFGPIPEGLLVRHKCDNRVCVNPDHLELGTHKDNSDDKISRGRDRKLRGMFHPRARLTKDQVIQIRQEYIRGSNEFGQNGLARKYGVTRSAISHVLKDRAWNEESLNTTEKHESPIYLPYSQLVKIADEVSLACPNCDKVFTIKGHRFKDLVKRGNINIFCDEKCYLEFKASSAEEGLQERFNSYTQVEDENDPDSCIIWTGRKRNSGRGLFHYKEKTYNAPRVAWFLATGEWPPDDKDVLQDCLNHSCVNIDHLFLGTEKEGAELKRISGNLWSKLTEEKVKQIRKLYKKGKKMRELAEEFNVSMSIISKVVRNKSWADENYKATSEKHIQKGEEKANTVLINEIVIEIKKDWDNKVLDMKGLMEKYNMKKSSVCNIIYRYNWKHLEYEGSLWENGIKKVG